MNDYFSWKQETLTHTVSNNITKKYSNGFVFTRRGKGAMDQTRSVRIDLSTLALTSENRRILRKTEDITLSNHAIPYTDYHWTIGKCAKDFYEKKFGKGTFSANAVKSCLTNIEETNFTTLLLYTKSDDVVGYAVCYENTDILHYSYPFYPLDFPNKSIGMGMMLKAILYAKETGKKYIYLGSAQRPSDTYKLQFNGLEWFDETHWNDDVQELKHILDNTL